MNLIQLSNPEQGRRIAVVDGSQLILIKDIYPTCYALFSTLIENDELVSKFITNALTDKKINYNGVYNGESPWKILPSFDHPKYPEFCMLSGTGLTHKASAENRQKMHQQASKNDDITDSMEIYLWGEAGGKPAKGRIGKQPEWFYKGNGSMLKALNEPLTVPPYAEDGGEEPEIAGVYLIAPDKTPYRVGFTMANEFSDHVMEKKNYLYLAPSKLRTCAIGPELVLDNNFKNIYGKVQIEHNGKEKWSKAIKSGEQNMSHSLDNLEYHHFKYDQHRIPGMVHIHFFGADAFSFGDQIKLQDDDQMLISFKGFGKTLKNPISISSEHEKLYAVQTFNL